MVSLFFCYDAVIILEKIGVIKVPQAGLKEYLTRNTSALINWTLHVPKEILQKQVRVGQLVSYALEDNPMVDFTNRSSFYRFVVFFFLF